MDTVTPSRVVALEVLQKLDKWRGFADELVDHCLQKSSIIDPRDKHLVTELVQGCLRWRIQLDYVIRDIVHQPLSKIHPVLLNILRIGTYQLLYTDRIPASAAVDESVKLVRKQRQIHAVAFVNAVLRKVSEEGKNILDKPLKDPVYNLSLKTAHPDWIVRRWIDRFGHEQCRELLNANNVIPPMALRVNTLKTDVSTVSNLLEKELLVVGKGKIARNCLSLSGRTLPPSHSLFQDGMVHVQDESSQLIPKILDPDPRDLVLDVCAAPGTKTTQLAALMRNRGEILAWDNHPMRLRMLKQNCERMGVKNVTVEQHDASSYDPRYVECFNKVLIDAPCTALGIIRRHPEIKWSRRETDFPRYSHLQLKLMEVCSSYLKKNGILVYSVCSTEPEEGEKIIEKFLEKNKKMQLVPEISRTLAEIKGIEYHDGWIRTVPPGWDGFFIAKLQRVN